MENENFIRTLSQYQIEQLKTQFVVSDIEHIGREDKTGDLIIEYFKGFGYDKTLQLKRISFNPPFIVKEKEIQKIK